MCDCLIISLGDEGFAIISDCSCNVYTSINQATSNNSGPNTHKRGHFGIFFSALVRVPPTPGLTSDFSVCAKHCGTCPFAIYRCDCRCRCHSVNIAGHNLIKCVINWILIVILLRVERVLAVDAKIE